MNLNPSIIGWLEFWMRLGVLFFVAVLLLLGVAMVARLLLTLGNGVTRAVRKIRGRVHDGVTQ